MRPWYSMGSHVCGNSGNRGPSHGPRGDASDFSGMRPLVRILDNFSVAWN